MCAIIKAFKQLLFDRGNVGNLGFKELLLYMKAILFRKVIDASNYKTSLRDGK